jgi:hypothetical protein
MGKNGASPTPHLPGRLSISLAVLVLFSLSSFPSASGAGNPKCFGKTPTKVGTAGDDTIFGTGADDVIAGLGGDDTIKAKGGDDRVCGNKGRDKLFGAAGDDKLNGGLGDDTCKQGPGSGTLISCGGGGGGGGGGNCDPAYPDFCIPPPPPDLDCADVNGTNFTVLPPDPHGLDADGDGVGCER